MRDGRASSSAKTTALCRAHLTWMGVLDDGVQQIAVIGAGYDSRAWRLARPGIRFFEVDHPATQHDKCQRAPAAGPGYVAADLRVDRLAEVLAAGGFEPALPTVFVVEGLTMYLAEAVVTTVLSDLSSVAAVGSRLAVNFTVRGGGSVLPVSRVVAKAVRTTWRVRGEVVYSWVRPEALMRLLSSTGSRGDHGGVRQLGSSERAPKARRPRRLFVVGLTLAALAGVVSGCSTPSHSADPSAAPSPAEASASAGTEAPAGSCAEPGRPTTVAYKTIVGIDSDLTSLDIHAPAVACGAPVVMWVHGGGYQIGDKASQIGDKARLFNQHGWILVSVNYRLTNPRDPNSAQYPDHFDDVAAAVAWVHTNIGSYGGDPAQVALFGHSAGADIVSNVADNPEYLAKQGLGLDALVCAGPLDTEGFDKAKAGADDPDGEKEQWRLALGNNSEYLTETSATALIKPGIGIPPTIGVVRGTAQRQQIESDYLAALQGAGILTTSIDARSLSHEQVNAQIGATGDTLMTGPVTSFLMSCFAP